ncbi:MAG: glycosyltransferase [Chloroflexi bacterium]|nr:glycosyltransferase [Chloroflexota bacterium]
MPAPIKVLLLTPQTPYPPDQGAPIRNYSFVRYLGQNPGFELSLLSFARPGEDPIQSPALAELKKYCHRVELVAHPPARTKLTRLRESLFGRLPDLAKRLASPAFEAALTRLLETENFDVIQCEALEMAPFLLERANLTARLVLDEHNAEYLLQKRIFEQDWQGGWKRRPAALYSRLQARRLADYERQALVRFDRAIAVSQPDRAALEKLGPTLHPIAVIPNGIDLDEFNPGPAGEEDPDRLVFTGTMDFRPNVDAVTWFVNEVWPLVRAKKPGARFDIVGRRPAQAVADLKSQPGIEVTGEVADARHYVRRSSLYVVPMRMGGGVRFKVLEALAMGKAVVTTAMGADGIDMTAGREAVVADSAADFAARILELLDDPARRTTLAKEGRRFVEQNFDWRKITPGLEAVLTGD